MKNFMVFEDGLVNMMAVEKVRMSADSFFDKADGEREYYLWLYGNHT